MLAGAVPSINKERKLVTSAHQNAAGLGTGDPAFDRYMNERPVLGGFESALNVYLWVLVALTLPGS